MLNTPQKDALYRVTLEPIGSRVEMPDGTTLLEAAQKAGVEINAVCAGNGTCGMCKVLPISGKFSSLTDAEKDQLQLSELSSDLRLACCTSIHSDCTVQFPPESLATLQRLQLEGKQNDIPVHAAVQRLEVNLTPPSLQEKQSDAERVREVLKVNGYLHTDIPARLMPKLIATLHEHQWNVSLVIDQHELIAVIPPDSRLLGYAVDIGTTKIAGYLVDLQTGQTLASGGATNPQIAYGEDVISRIQYTDEHPQGSETLQKILVQAINELLDDLCQQASANPGQVVDSVMVGNTAMHHLLAGIPVHSLGTSPYLAGMLNAMCVQACKLGLKMAEGAHVYLPPNIAGFVGGDHVAMLLATNARNRLKTVVALDIGTNTEISLIHKGRHLACSCASGPAFEGAHIRDGMRAIPGAIEHLFIDESKVIVQTIQNNPALGICGSGIVDAVAEMRSENLIDARGTFNKEDKRLKNREETPEFVLVHADQSGTRRDITLNRKDINEIQLAKAAIRSGVEVLMHQAHIEADDIDLFVVAGAFGTYLDLKNTLRIGMFPTLPIERFQQVGNAAGSGARELLVSIEKRDEAERMVEQIEYIELTTAKEYSDIFMRAITLD